MITIENLRQSLLSLGFNNTSGNILENEYDNGAKIRVDFDHSKIDYLPLDSSFNEGDFPSTTKEASGFVIHRDTTLNFYENENFVCLICIHFLLKKGYEPKHIVIEPAFRVGHINKPSYGDILVFDKQYQPLVLIENKTFGTEFSKEWNLMQKNGGQLFSYLGPLVNTLGPCKYLTLFCADFDDGSVIYKNRIITLLDNEKRIQELNTQKTFAQAQGKYFEIWSETYDKSFETKGLFEKDISPYTIGKQKFTIDDLKSLSHAEIKPIFNEFATILRNHAITDFEHSFYILIDLFLCKITDEKNNPDDLQFFYKGVTRDTPKEYCNRLLRLYQLGKKQMFDINVINKEESDILQVFEDTNRAVTNGLYAGIKELFEEIKFYNIKKFNFISVENKEDFENNFEIIIKVTALIQDINLSNSETNHFFGDLFEGLLSKNVHQTEGQFFTPLPIVNFIIKSLPKFPNNGELKVLDYACGAGHFLTEFIKHYDNAKIYGIEKSQTLSQVAKIASIINGGKNTKIVCKDALSIFDATTTRFEGFEKESFDLIIANPPYSVDGYLDTIDEDDRQQFELIQYVDEKTYETQDAIECFFLERASFFLKQYGLMGIVLPVSVLTNEDLYIKTRELLFSNFNILGITSLSKRTFGSTGTNTIILFAQKVKKNAEGLVHTYIEKKDFTQYVNYESIEEYINKQGYDKNDYDQFMQNKVLTDNLFATEIFQDYSDNFKPSKISKNLIKKWFAESSFYTDDKTKAKSAFEQFQDSDEFKALCEAEAKKQFVEFAREIEIDKLKTFVQIYKNNVAILQSPPEKINNKSNKDEIVKFLGYDWSSKRGNEGIKYVTDNFVPAEQSEEDDEDVQLIENINSISYIKTPLYNPNDSFDCHKFAYAFRKHFDGVCSKYSFQKDSSNLDNAFDPELQGLFSTEDLSNLIDFSSVSFKKKIRTVPIKKIELNSDYKVHKLGKLAESWFRGQGLQKDEIVDGGKYPCIHYGELFTKYNAIIEDIVSKTNLEMRIKSKDGDILFPASDVTPDGLARCSVIVKKDISLGSDIIVCRPKASFEGTDINPRYLSFFINSQRVQMLPMITGSNVKHISGESLKNLQIPLPPEDVQKKVVDEATKLLNSFVTTRMEIQEYREKLSEIFKRERIIL